MQTTPANNSEAINLAEQYLHSHGTEFISPGEILKESENEVLVSILKPEALDPKCVIDPPDYRFVINRITREVIYLPQM